MNDASAAPSRRRASIIGVLNQYGAIGVMVLQGFALVPLYLRHIDPRAYGAWLATGNVIGWLAFIDPGLSAVVQQRISHAYGDGDRARMEGAIGTGLVLNLGVAAALGGAGVALSPFIPGLVRVEGPLAAQIASACALAAAGEGVLLSALALASVLMALMAFPLTTGVLYVVGSLAGIAATVVFLSLGFGIRAIALGLIVRASLLLVANVVLLTYVLTRRVRLRPRFSRDDLRAIAGLSAYTWLARVGGALISNLDAFLIARLMGTGHVPVFVLTRRAVDLIGQVTSRVGAAFGPALSHLHGEGDRAKLARVSRRLITLVGAVSAMGLGGYVGLNRAFVRLWVGGAFYGGPTLTLLLGLAVTWQALQLNLSSTLFATGHVRNTSTATIAEALLRLLLVSALLALGAGLHGVALGALAAGMAANLWLLLSLHARLIELDRRAAGRFYGAIALRCAGLALVGLLWDRLAPTPASWPALALSAAALSAVEAALLLATSPALRDEARPLVDRVRRRLFGARA